MTIKEAIATFEKHGYEPENPAHNTKGHPARDAIKAASKVRNQALTSGTWPGDPAPRAAKST